uniref:Uncharacterized protein n=1 Tax=Anguilla anguilla TaxID=7936 RepID=A0A0E9U8L5_ANGAN
MVYSVHKIGATVTLLRYQGQPYLTLFSDVFLVITVTQLL